MARRASYHVATAFSTRLKLIWPRSNLSQNHQNVKKTLAKSSRGNGLMPYSIDNVDYDAHKRPILFQFPPLSEAYCVVPQNIHTPPMEGFSNWTLHPSKNSLLVPYFHSKNLAFETPLPLRISINLSWGRYGYFLELHIVLGWISTYQIGLFAGNLVTDFKKRILQYTPSAPVTELFIGLCNHFLFYEWILFSKPMGNFAQTATGQHKLESWVAPVLWQTLLNFNRLGSFSSHQ